MSVDKTLYIIANIAAIGTITGMCGAVFYCEKDKKKTEFCINVSIVSALVLITSPFVSNIADVLLKN